MDEKQIRVTDVTEATLWYVACCAHVDHGDQGEQAAARLHEDWLRRTLTRGGMYVQVALDGDEPIGFAFLIPVERTAWYVQGHDLLTLQCMNVQEAYRGQGVGAQLLAAAEETARAHAQGLALIAYDPSDWFMPAPFFAAHGYQEAERRGSSVLMFKPFSPEATPPAFVPRRYRPPRLIPGRVIVEAFWSPQCLNTALDILHVREVCAEFGERVELREYNASMPGMRERFGIPRTILVNGREIGWGYALPQQSSFDGAERSWSHHAPKQWLREQIEAALKEA